MQSRIRNHIRANVVGYVAVFLAMTGTAAALPGNNTVDSGDIINGQVRTGELATDAVTTGKIRNGDVRTADLRANSVGTGRVADGSLRGADLLDGSVGLADLAGDSVDSSKVANGSIGLPDLAGDSVDSSKVANGSLTGGDVGDTTLTGTDLADGSVGGADVAESTLSQVPSAVLGGFGRGGAEQDTCNPSGAGFATCAGVGLTVPAGLGSGARALVIGRVTAFAGAGGSFARGFCRLDTSTVGVVPNSSGVVVTTETSGEGLTVAGISPRLAPGVHQFRIDCNEDDTFPGSIDYFDASVIAVAIAAN